MLNHLFKKSLIIVALLLLCLSHLSAQEISFNHITTDDGLLSGNVRIILQDYQGFIWLGTEDGLQRYDGHSMVSYHHKESDSTSLSSNYILYLFEDSRKNLWIGTLDAGLCLYDRSTDSFKRFINDPSDKNSILGNYVRVIYESADSTLYIGLEQGGFSFFKTPSRVEASIKFTNVAIPIRENSSSANLVGTIVEDADHTLLIGSNGGGINRFNTNTGTFQPVLKDSCSNNIHHIFLDSKNRLWVGTWNDGLYIYDRQSKQLVHHLSKDRAGFLSQNQIETLSEGRDGSFWIGTDNGLCIIPNNVDPFSPAPFTIYKHDELEPSSLLSNSIKTFYTDARDRIWIGSYYGGVNIYDKNALKFYPIKSKAWLKGSLTHNNVFAFEEDSMGNLWVGTDGGGLNVAKGSVHSFSKIEFSKIPLKLDGAPVDKIKCLEFDHNGDLWIGTWGMGIFRLNTKTMNYEHFGRDTKNGLLADEVLNINVDSLNNLWIGTFNGGLNYFDQKRRIFINSTTSFGTINPQQINRITATHVGKQGEVWVAREVGGLNRMDGAKQKMTLIENGALTKYLTILCIYEDPLGVLWLGTNTNGLIRYDPRKNEVKLYNEESGIINNVVYAILPDTANATLWLSTNKGISVLNLAQGTFTNYNKADGLQGNQFNQGSAFLLSSGLMLFGGTEGMNIFDPGKIRKNSQLSPIVFTRFWVENVEVEVNDTGSPLKQNIILAPTIHLTHKQNSFSIEFSMLEFNFTKRNQYAYFLEELNTTWQNIGTERKATFTNLNPGTYVLRVKASNSDGVWSENEEQITIIIHPAWWQTMLFKVSLLVGILLLTFAAIRIRIQYLLQQKKKLETQVTERTTELKKTNSELADRVQEIQSQNNVLHSQKIEIAEMNQEIQAQNEELTSQNDQINLQRDSLEAARRKLQDVNDQLEVLVLQRTQKLEETITELDKTVAELDRFVYSASHDLSAPLKSVLGLVRIARFEKDPDMLQKYYEYIEGSIQKLDRVIKSLVEFSRNSHQEVRKERFNLHQLTEDVLQELAYWPEAQKIKFINQLAPDTQIVSDQDRLKVILHNLIGNSIKYSDFTKPESIVRIEAQSTDSSFVLKISDNGIGIENEKQNKIFDMYYRGTDRSKGSGLGLFIVKEILLKVKGKIELTSSLGEGTTFHLSFNTAQTKEDML